MSGFMVRIKLVVIGVIHFNIPRIQSTSRENFLGSTLSANEERDKCTVQVREIKIFNSILVFLINANY